MKKEIVYALAAITVINIIGFIMLGFCLIKHGL